MSRTTDIAIYLTEDTEGIWVCRMAYTDEQPRTIAGPFKDGDKAKGVAEAKARKIAGERALVLTVIPDWAEGIDPDQHDGGKAHSAWLIR